MSEYKFTQAKIENKFFILEGIKEILTIEKQPIDENLELKTIEKAINNSNIFICKNNNSYFYLQHIK